MYTFTFQALQILIFLIPGFLSGIILDTFIVREKEKEFEKIIVALIFSMLIYTIYSFISGKSPVELIQDQQSTKLFYDGKSFFWLIVLCISIPVILSFLFTNDWHMKLARWLRITRRTARKSVWFDVFCDKQVHIIVNFDNGRRIYGWPMYYSDDPDSPYIFLHKPAWIEEDENGKGSKWIDIDIEGILITPEQKIESIEFLKE